MELSFAKYGIGRSSVMLNDINERIYGKATSTRVRLLPQDLRGNYNMHTNILYCSQWRIIVKCAYKFRNYARISNLSDYSESKLNTICTCKLAPSAFAVLLTMYFFAPVQLVLQFTPA